MAFDSNMKGAIIREIISNYYLSCKYEPPLLRVSCWDGCIINNQQEERPEKLHLIE